MKVQIELDLENQCQGERLNKDTIIESLRSTFIGYKRLSSKKGNSFRINRIRSL